MKKKILLIILIPIVFFILLTIFTLLMFKAQYNSNGVSHFLVITIDKSVTKKYIGELEGHSVYIDKLDEDNTNFRTMDAENLSIKNAIEKNLVSIEDWEKYAFYVKKDGSNKILKFDNYEIYISKKECIIRPLIR